MARFRAANDEYVRRNRVLIRLQGLFYPSMTLFLGFGSLAGALAGKPRSDPRPHHGRRVRRLQRLPGDVELADDCVRLGHQHPAARHGLVEADARGARRRTGHRRSRGVARRPRGGHPGTDRDPRPDIHVSDVAGTRRSTDVSLRIEAGQTAAFIGATGSGKSTLISLLPRLHEPPPGTVFLDGVDVREIPLATLRGAIGFVPQEPFLFSDTIAENIAFGVDARIGRTIDARRAHSRRGRRRAAGQGRRDVPARLRHARRRARHHAVGRAEAAHALSPAR